MILRKGNNHAACFCQEGHAKLFRRLQPHPFTLAMTATYPFSLHDGQPLGLHNEHNMWSFKLDVLMAPKDCITA